MQDEPGQAIGADGLVEAVNAVAFAAGIRRGMRRGEAEGICPTVVSLDRDRGVEMAEFEAVMVAIEDLVPRVEVIEPGLVMVRKRGCDEPRAGSRSCMWTLYWRWWPIR